MKNKEDIMAALSHNLPVVENKEEPAPLSVVGDNDIVHDTEEDYEFARERIKKLIDTSDNAIAAMHDLALDAEHPRAFEVLGGLIKQAADMNNQLLDLQKQRKNLVIPKEKSANSGNTTNNAIFVGTTTELQKFLKDQKSQEVIDVE